MLARNIGVVLVRLFCIYLAISAVQSLSYVVPGFVQYRYQGGDIQDLLTSASLWLMITSILLPAICAFWLWRNSDFVIPQNAFDDGSSATASEIMLIGISLLGIYLLVSGLTSLVRVESAFAGSAHADSTARIPQRLSHLAEIVISVLLLFGRGRLSTLLLKAKYAGTGAN
jgi:formate-dependent nitrite reductase membrane component NrfD